MSRMAHVWPNYYYCECVTGALLWFELHYNANVFGCLMPSSFSVAKVDIFVGFLVFFLWFMGSFSHALAFVSMSARYSLCLLFGNICFLVILGVSAPGFAFSALFSSYSGAYKFGFAGDLVCGLGFAFVMGAGAGEHAWALSCAFTQTPPHQQIMSILSSQKNFAMC